jgi:hypothetical protein
MRYILVDALVLCVTAIPVLADWNADDPTDQAKVKMHFAQLPDLNTTGMDVQFDCNPTILGDDWQCTETGAVSDIHLWFSSLGDGYPTVNQIASIYVAIYSNNPGPPSMPAQLLWESYYEPDDPEILIRKVCDDCPQGRYEPETGLWIPIDHQQVWQLNITNIEEPFEQQEGEIYWLVAWMLPVIPQPGFFGWKTSDFNQYPGQYEGAAFMDDAVWANCLVGPPYMWLPNVYPIGHPYEGQSFDLAFVITTTAIPTLNQWGLIALALLLVATSVVLIRRRRTVQT